MKKARLSFLSLLAAIVLLVSTLVGNSSTVSAATGGDESTREENYEGTRDENYESDVRDDNYGDGDVPGENYYDENEFDEGYDDEDYDDEDYDFVYLDKEEVNKRLDKNGNLTLQNPDLIYLDKGAINALKGKLIVNKGNAKVEIPNSVLKQVLGNTNEVWIDVSSLSAEDLKEFLIDKSILKHQVSDVLSFAFYNSDDWFRAKFKEPIIITFKVDPSKVNNWRDLVLYYFDDYGIEHNYTNQILSVNPKTGEVVVEIFHFSAYVSAYGIFEIPGSNGVGADKIKSGVGADKIKSTDTSGESGAKVSVKLDDEEKVVATSGTDGTDGGKLLPKTATNSYNLLLLGTLISLAGAVLVLTRKRIKA